MRKSKTLFIDTVSGGLTLRLFEDSKLMASSISHREDRIAESFISQLSKLLQSANGQTTDLDQILVCNGPGGFTSARIGVCAGNALSFGLKIPIAAISLFDLFPEETFTFVTANPAETWVRFPGKNPAFLTWQVLSEQLPTSFSFQGVLKDPWNKRLEEQGGKWKKKKLSPPDFSKAYFEMKMIKPWYYKEAHITWSEKHVPLYRLNTNRESG